MLAGLPGRLIRIRGGGEPLDRFYHHWFTSDEDVMRLVAELGLSDQVSTVEPS